jgi:hypothetical protein
MNSGTEKKEASVMLKDKGNQLFQNKKFVEAIEAYSQAIVSTIIIIQIICLK